MLNLSKITAYVILAVWVWLVAATAFAGHYSLAAAYVAIFACGQYIADLYIKKYIRNDKRGA